MEKKDIKFLYDFLDYKVTEKEIKDDLNVLNNVFNQENITGNSEFINDLDYIENNYKMGYYLSTKDKDHETSLVWNNDFINFINDEPFKEIINYCKKKNFSIEDITKMNILYNKIKLKKINNKNNIYQLENYVYYKN